MRNIEKIFVLLLFAIAIVGIIAPANAVSTWKTDEQNIKIEEKAKTVKYKVTFNGNGGKIGSKKTVAINVKKGAKIGKLPKNPKRSGYIFKGWFTKKIGGTKITTNIKPTKSLTYTARWENAKLKIIFNATGGKIGTKKTKPITAIKGKKIGKLPTSPKRTGFTFMGWYTKENSGKKITKNTKPSKSVSYYAQWEIKNKELVGKWEVNVNNNEKRKVIDGIWQYNAKEDMYKDLAPLDYGYMTHTYIFEKNGNYNYKVMVDTAKGDVLIYEERGTYAASEKLGVINKDYMWWSKAYKRGEWMFEKKYFMEFEKTIQDGTEFLSIGGLDLKKLDYTLKLIQMVEK